MSIIGSSNTTYILEKSRVVFQSKDERNYHVFYQLLQGSTPQELHDLRLSASPTARANLTDYYYINQSGCITINDVDDAKDFAEANDAFREIGFSMDDQKSLYRTIAGILNLGNVSYLPNNDESIIAPDTEVYFNNACYLFGVDPELFRKALLFKKIKSGGGKRASIAFSPYSPNIAVDTRDALMKETYRRCFDWIVDMINRLMFNDKVKPKSMIGVLDIFGFEIFKNVRT